MSIESKTLSVPQSQTPQVKTVYIDQSKPKVERAIAILERILAAEPRGQGKALSQYREMVKEIAEEGMREIRSGE